MDNALAALYVWFSLVLCVLFAFSRRPLSTAALALHVALSLGLAAHIAWRRLHGKPVEGELLDCSKRFGSRIWSYDWRWSYGGATYTARDDDMVGILVESRSRATLWVDPRDPSRILPPSWRGRILLYLIFGGVSAYNILLFWGVV